MVLTAATRHTIPASSATISAEVQLCTPTASDTIIAFVTAAVTIFPSKLMDSSGRDTKTKDTWIRY